MTHKKRHVFIIVIFCLAAFYLIVRSFPALGFTLDFFVVPLQKASYRLGSSLSSYAEVNQLKEENWKLREQISRLFIDYVKLGSLESENDYLRQELDFVENRSFSFELAHVIGRPARNRNVIIIDKGRRDGLVLGQPVTVAGGIMVGKIIEVTEVKSFVQLLTDPQSQIAVTASTVTGTNGLVKGQTGNALLLDLVPQSVPLSENDLIITSGLEEKIPKGLLVGYVIKVENSIGEVFKQSRLSLPFNYDNLQLVTVLK